MFQTHRVLSEVGIEEPFMDGATVSTLLFTSLTRSRRCETASAARLLQRIVRRAVSRAASTFGESADNMRRQVLALMTMLQRHSFSSFAIESVVWASVLGLSSWGLAMRLSFVWLCRWLPPVQRSRNVNPLNWFSGSESFPTDATPDVGYSTIHESM